MQYDEKQWKQLEINHKPPLYGAVEDQRKMGKNQHFGQFVIKERIDTTCYIILFILDLFLENWKVMVSNVCMSQKYIWK